MTLLASRLSPSRAFGVRFAPVAARPATPPFRPLMPESATGERHASIHAGMPFADPSPEGGSLRSRRWFVPAHFAPCLCGGRNGPVSLIAVGRFAPALSLFPPPPPGGGNGERKGKRGYAGLGMAPRWGAGSGAIPPALHAVAGGSVKGGIPESRLSRIQAFRYS